MLRRRSLRSRMTATMTAVFAVWVALICSGLYAYFHHLAAERADQRLTIAARDVALDLHEGEPRPGSAATSLPRATAVLASEARESVRQSDIAYLVVGAENKVVWRSQRSIPPWPKPDKNWRVMMVPADANTVVVALDWRQTEEELHKQALGLLFLGLLTVAAAAFGSWVLVGRTLSPISRLSRHARGASADGLRVHLQAPSDDAEITELVGTLNGLLERVAEAAAAKGRFYAAASHELRTPLQALSGHLEVALSRPRRAEEYQATVTEALLQTRRLTRLAQDLLLLNQLDSTPSAQPGEPVDLAEVCERALRQVQPVITQRGLRPSTEAVAEATIVAPPAHVDVLARNLIENAVRYATPGGEVRLSLQAQEGGAVLAVYNTHPPIADWRPAALLEAFERLDHSRSSTTGGNGLGLAICGAIAKANRWSLTLDHDGRGVLATVVFGNASGEGRSR